MTTIHDSGELLDLYTDEPAPLPDGELMNVFAEPTPDGKPECVPDAIWDGWQPPSPLPNRDCWPG